MNRLMKIALAAIALLAAAGMAAAQSAASGFNVQDLIVKLSLYLPEDMAQGARVFAAPPGGAGAQEPAGAGAQTQGARTQNAPAQQGAAQPRPQFQYARNEKLYLTRDQTSKLIPIIQGLRENPLPSPTKAKKIESDVASILTAAQKSEYDKYQKAMEKFRQSLQQSGGAAAGTGAGQQPRDFQNMTDAQRQELINSLTPEQRQQLQQRAAQGGQAGAGGAQLSQTERRQRQLDEFIAVLQNWEKKAK